MELITINNVGGTVVKDNDVYTLKDNKTLKNLVLSSTELKPNKSTRGHNHVGQEEVYFFIRGTGVMYLNDVPRTVQAGDIVLIEDGVHHRVESQAEGLYFVCVFDGERKH